jgi:hypothetical protein
MAARALPVEKRDDRAEDPPWRKRNQECVVRFVFRRIPPECEYAKQDLPEGIRDKRAQEAQFVVPRRKKPHRSAA